MIKLNRKLISNPKVALEVMMEVTAALYVGMNKDTPLKEAGEIAGLCAGMWRVCDVLQEMAGGDENG